MHRLLLVAIAIAGCGNSGDRAPAGEPCTCTPDRDTLDDAHATALLARLRKHVRDTRDGKNARDIKVDDDELRLAITNLCSPCQRWVDDRAAIADLYPLAALDGATGARCLALVTQTGALAYGAAHPAACAAQSSTSASRP